MFVSKEKRHKGSTLLSVYICLSLSRATVSKACGDSKEAHIQKVEWKQHTLPANEYTGYRERMLSYF